MTKNLKISCGDKRKIIVSKSKVFKYIVSVDMKAPDDLTSFTMYRHQL